MSLHPRRLREWATVLRQLAADAPLWWRAYAFAAASLKMARALLSGPVPRSVWRARLRTCRRCPIYDPTHRACRKHIVTITESHATLGCSCYVPFLALTAAPSHQGCWARQHLPHEGWPSHRFPSLLARLRATLQFLLNRTT